MNVSLNWLKQYVDIPDTPDRLAEILTTLGLEIEKVERPGAEIQSVVIGQILSIEQHPDADKIVVCKTDVGGEQPLQICCGAKNMKVGDKVPTAVVGATLPGGFAIGRRKMRGVESEGMMCSSRELGLGEDSDGLMILPEDLPVGADAKEVLGLDDVIYEIEVTPNRGDWASMIGVARELAAYYGGELRVPEVKLTEADKPASSVSSVTVEDPDLCPLYLGRVLTNVNVGPSPEWLQNRLIAAGQRPINNIVDITNFVLLETGQPLHAFDLDKLSDHRVVVRRAKAGEKITTLDEVERTLDAEMLMICDASSPQCVGGVMGGSTSEVSETTQRIFLESAFFQPRSVRRTARTLGLSTESSQRFQRGADPEMTRYALERAAQLMQELAGAQVLEGVLKSYPEPFTQREVTLPFSKTRQVLGAEISPERQQQYLERLGFEILTKSAGDICVRVPLRRHDVSIPEDLIEDIARLEGYEQLPAALPRVRPSGAVVSPEDKTVRELRRALVGMGLTEFFNWTFSNREDMAKTGLDPEADVVGLTNPLSEKQAFMRTSLLPGLLNNAGHNVRHGNENIAAFEIGPVFVPNPNEELPYEPMHLGLLLSGSEEKHWSGEARAYDFYDLKGILAAVFEFFSVDLQIEAIDHASLQPGQSAQVLLEKSVIGKIGKLAPSVGRNFEIEQAVFVAEVNLSALLLQPKRPALFTSLPQFPASLRDLAVVVNREVEAAKLVDAATRVGGNLLQGVSVFDIYTGKPIAEGQKSVALSLKFQAADRTLTDADTQKAVDKIVRTLEKECGASLR